MTGIVVDASITLSWCFPDEQAPLALQVLDRLQRGERALVPSFWPVEVLNVLLVGERKGRIAPTQTNAFLHMLLSLRPVIDHASLEQITDAVQTICRSSGLTPYDALYVELASRTGYPLATLDEPQRRAAQTLGLPCL